ncbi:MAG: tetratricopeptide repeat protein [Potamolinea sp.]
MAINFLNRLKPTNPDKPLGGRYKLISQLGSGGFGQTFLAEDLHLPGHPRCVIKQLKPQVSDAKSLEMARRLFDTEARVLYQLGDHDQIPRLLAHFEDDQEFYLAQELIEGDPLTQELSGGKVWREAKVIAMLQDLLKVLAFVHEQNVIHRDIKPSNLIRRREDDAIVLIDFGAVKQVSTQFLTPDSGDTKTISIGTQGYTPKEQLGGNPRYSSDVYAVGIIAIQALTGVHPRLLPEDPQTGEITWRERAPQTSLELTAILDCMVCYDFRSRYPNATAALEALSTLPGLGTNSEATTSGTDLSATNLWVRTEPTLPPTEEQKGVRKEQPATNLGVPTASPLPPTARNTAAKTPHPPLPPLENSTPLVSTPGTPKQSFVPWIVLAVLGVGGASFWFAQPFILPQSATQTANSSAVTAESSTDRQTQKPASPSPASTVAAIPTTASNTTPSPTPSPAAPVKTPTLLSPITSNVPSPTASIAEKPIPASPVSTPVPSPTASIVAKPASPVPIAPPVSSQMIPSNPPPPVAKPSPPRPEPQATELLTQADRLREAGQYQKAIATYDQAIASAPDNPQAHWGRCYGLNALNQSNEAIASCNKALELKPNYPEALWSKGSILEQQQRPQEALKLYEQATTLKPDFAEAWNNQGVALLALGRSREAISAFDKATLFKPDLASAWANRGAALWNLKRFNLAIVSMDKALQIQPDNKEALNLRQQAREKLGR